MLDYAFIQKMVDQRRFGGLLHYLLAGESDNSNDAKYWYYRGLVASLTGNRKGMSESWSLATKCGNFTASISRNIKIDEVVFLIKEGYPKMAKHKLDWLKTYFSSNSHPAIQTSLNARIEVAFGNYGKAYCLFKKADADFAASTNYNQESRSDNAVHWLILNSYYINELKSQKSQTTCSFSYSANYIYNLAKYDQSVARRAICLLVYRLPVMARLFIKRLP